MSIQLIASLLIAEIRDCNSHEQLKSIRLKISRWQEVYEDSEMTRAIWRCYERKRESLLSLKVYVKGLACMALKQNMN